MKPSLAERFAVLALIWLAAVSRLAADEPVVIRLGTIMPSGTAQLALLQELGERWRQDSGGTVKLVLYPDGRLGGESEMVKKLRIKQLNAGFFSGIGLSDIDATVTGLQLMPLMFRSWEEVDYVREKIQPQLEQRLRAKGFAVLFWADAGWVRFFSKEAATRPEEYQRMKMFVWVGDNTQISIMQATGYQPVPLETSDILLGLNTNMITTVALPPFAALAGRISGAAPHMLEVNWVPMVGAVIVRTDIWEKIPVAVRVRLQAVADDIGEKIRTRGRRDGEESVKAMQQHGLQVHKPTAADERAWNDFAALLWKKIRGPIVPPEIFDAVESHLREFRARQP